ncbi:hypothetical protein QFZ58_006435 [Streptomyces sp. B1I3]|nr:hypothetical protein [Streptomyces sp. B1I3]
MFSLARSNRPCSAHADGIAFPCGYRALSALRSRIPGDPPSATVGCRTGRGVRPACAHARTRKNLGYALCRTGPALDVDGPRGSSPGGRAQDVHRRGARRRDPEEGRRRTARPLDRPQHLGPSPCFGASPTTTGTSTVPAHTGESLSCTRNTTIVLTDFRDNVFEAPNAYRVAGPTSSSWPSRPSARTAGPSGRGRPPAPPAPGPRRPPPGALRSPAGPTSRSTDRPGRTASVTESSCAPAIPYAHPRPVSPQCVAVTGT